MKQRSAEECITRILRDIEKRRDVDLMDKNSIRRYNAAFDRIYENTNYLFDNHPNKTHLFMELVNHSDYSIASHCTSVLFRVRTCTREQKLIALASAKRLLLHPMTDSVGKLAWRKNIELWERDLQKNNCSSDE